jgi:hypothetical protein
MMAQVRLGVNLLFRVSVQSELGLGTEKGCNRSIKSIVGNFASLVWRFRISFACKNIASLWKQTWYHAFESSRLAAFSEKSGELAKRLLLLESFVLFWSASYDSYLGVIHPRHNNASFLSAQNHETKIVWVLSLSKSTSCIVPSVCCSIAAIIQMPRTWSTLRSPRITLGEYLSDSSS